MPDNLNHYLQQWTLRDPELLARNPTSNVYAVTQNAEKVILKLLTPIGVEDEYAGADALRHFDGDGAVWLLDYDDGAHLLEYAGDQELAQLVWRGDDLAAAEIIAQLLNKLHHPQTATPVPAWRTLRERFRELFRQAERDASVGNQSIYVRGARMAERLLATSRDECVLHGDIHHHNIRLHPVRGWLAYDPKGLYGERLYDAANTLCNPSNARERVISEERMLAVTQVLADGMRVNVSRLRAFVFAYACLSASWFGEDDESDDKYQTLTVAQNAERHVEDI